MSTILRLLKNGPFLMLRVKHLFFSIKYWQLAAIPQSNGWTIFHLTPTKPALKLGILVDIDGKAVGALL